MINQTDEFKHESLQDCQSIVEYLNSLCDGFERKHLVLRSENNEVIVKPHGLLKFEIKARKRSDRVKLSLKISWNDGMEEDEGSNQLVIQSESES